MAIVTELNCNLRETVKVQYLDGNLFSQDVYGNVIRVVVMDGDEPATLTGNVSGLAIRADGGTVAISDATLSDNVATIVLPAAAYAVPGVIAVTIKISDASTTTTLASFVANVYQTSTETAVDPGTIIPSITALIEEIETVVATIPGDYSTLWASLAPTFSSGTSYAVGQYVTYDGGLYKFKNPHSGSWSASDVDAVDLGAGITKNANDIADLKSAIKDVTGNNVGYSFEDGYWISTSGTVDITAKEVKSTYSCCVVACSAGDVFTLTGSGTTTAHLLYTFINSSGTKLLSASSNENAKDKVLTAPSNAAYLVVNAYRNSNAYPKRLIGGKAIKLTVSDNFNWSETKDRIIKNNGIKASGIRFADWEKDIYILTPDIGETASLYKNKREDRIACIMDMNEGEMLYWSGQGGTSSNGRAWAFVDEDNVVLKVSASTLSGSHSAIAPAGTAKVILNNFTVYNDTPVTNQYAFIGEPLNNQISTIRNSMKTITGNELLDNWLEGYWYYTGGSTIDVLNPTEHTNSACQYVACSKGDKFTVTGNGGTSSYALYAFLDSDGNRLQKARSRLSITDEVIVAPENSAYLIVNCVEIDDPHYLYRGEYVSKRLDNLEQNGFIPDYYFDDDYLTDIISTVNGRNLVINGDSFIFVTDYHAHKNSGHTPSIADYIYENTGISKMLFGGDIGTSTGLNSIKTNSLAFKTLQGCIPNFYACVGNHEWKVSDSSTSAGTYNNVYNYYINQMDAKVSRMSDFGDFWVESNGQRIRYFFINQNIDAKITSISLKWFMQELLNVPAGYGIVVIMHNAYHNKTYNNLASRKYLGYLNWTDNNVGLTNVNVRRISQIMYAVKTRTAVKYALRPYDGTTARESDITPKNTNDNCGNYNPILSTFPAGTNTGTYTDIVSFDGSEMNEGVYPIAIFCGHKHEDAACDPASASSFDDMTDENTIYLLNDTWYRYDSESEEWVAMLAAPGASDLSQTETLPPILVIMSTTDCYALKHEDELDPTVREVGTITEQAFDIVQIDTKNRKVYCTRIGGGVDREFSF